MKPGQNIHLGAWVLISLNLLMAFSCIWIFVRMAPAIQVILKQNDHSILACEEMLTIIAEYDLEQGYSQEQKSHFEQALYKAQTNVTEADEPKVLEAIQKTYPLLFQGEHLARKKTISQIVRLIKINREAMKKADSKAQQLGNAGAWGVVFMASFVFFTGMLFIQQLKKTVIYSLEELNKVMADVLNGNTLRRCTAKDLPKDIQGIFSTANELLDRFHILWLKKS